jgi:uncharacterized protein (TIGR00661 family)
LIPGKNILVCPLDWGLGHATRCVPVINKFLETGANVIIAADNRPLAFLKEEFPDLQFISFPGYNIRYPKGGNMALQMLLSIPKILHGIKTEHRTLDKIIDENTIDIVVSDNRYGLWNKRVRTVFITHQLSIKCSGWIRIFQWLLFLINRHYINKFDECWVPDFQGGFNISGSLSKLHERFKNIHFIGMLSRFKKVETAEDNALQAEYEILFVLSGPEPQRSVFESLIVSQIKTMDMPSTLIVRGMTEGKAEKQIAANVLMVDHVETLRLEKLMREAKLIFCRPGYSSIMDLVTMGKNAVFVPTPGQTEQEYLARYYAERKLFCVQSQKNFSITKALQEALNYHGMRLKPKEADTLSQRIRELLK